MYFDISKDIATFNEVGIGSPFRTVHQAEGLVPLIIYDLSLKENLFVQKSLSFVRCAVIFMNWLNEFIFIESQIRD